MEEYYALCVKWDDAEDYEVAPLDLGEDENGKFIALAVYSSEDGPLQREDLEKYGGDGDIEVREVSAHELLEAIRRIIPHTVFVDGRKYAGSVLKGYLRMVENIP